MEGLREWYASIEMGAMLALVWQVLGAILIFVIGRWIVKAIIGLMGRAMKKREFDELIVSFLTKILYVVLLLCVVLIAIDYLGIAVTPLIAVLGGAALAIGLALQSSLSNFASGLMLVGFRPFATGNFVEAGGVSGTVQSVGIFQTKLTTPDNRHVIVPNSEITSQPITNYSAFDTRRIDLVIGVSYDDDLKKAREVIGRVIEAHDKVLDDPEPTIMVLDLADSSVNFAVRPWVNTSDYWPTRGELLEQLKVELEAAGCSIPYPQRDVHLFKESQPD